MLKGIFHTWKTMRRLPPRVACRKAWRRLNRPLDRRRDRGSGRKSVNLIVRGRGSGLPDRERGLYGGLLPPRPEPGDLKKMLENTGLDGAVAALAGEALLHRFDLLGSGPVNVSCFTDAAGYEGYRYAIPPGKERHDLVLRQIGGALGLRDACRDEAGAGRNILWERFEKYSPVDWHLDFRSGYRWDPAAWYRDVLAEHHPGADPKVPWELSRFQHLGVMGLAYLRAEGETAERFAAEFALQATDWIVSNPPRCGINWNCPMEAAIRAVNWLWAVSLFRGAAALTPSFMRLLSWSLSRHALFLRGNLENDGPFVGNHYLANLAGIIYLEAACPWLPRSNRWLAFAASELLGEMRRQVHPDGTNFEASTGYHCLVTEIFYSAALLLMRLPRQRRAQLQKCVPDKELAFLAPGIFPSWFLQRLLGMAEFISHLTMPGGSIPQFGDFDGGRLHKLTPAVSFDRAAGRYREKNRDFRPLLAVAGRAFGRQDLLGQAQKYSLEGELLAGRLGHEIREALSGAAACITGGSARSHVRPAPGKLKKEHRNGEILLDAAAPVTTVIEIKAAAFAVDNGGAGANRRAVSAGPAYYPNAGIAAYHRDNYCLVVNCGPHGSEGLGVHTHNDKLSFHLNVAALDFIVDPGSFVYTALPDERNNFRSTRFHNTVVLPGNEQNQWLPGPSGIFSLPEQSRATVLEVSGKYFAGLLSGNGFNHRRDFFFSNDGLTIEDRLERAARFELLFNLHPSVQVTELGEGSFLLKRGGIEVRLAVSAGRDRVRGRLEKGFYSPGYGVKLPAVRIAVKIH